MASYKETTGGDIDKREDLLERLTMSVQANRFAMLRTASDKRLLMRAMNGYR